MLNTMKIILIYLIMAHTKETVYMSHESNDGFISTAFNYTEGSLTYPFPKQFAIQKIFYYLNDTGITLHCPIQGVFDEIDWIIVEPSVWNIYSIKGRIVTRIAQILEPLPNGSIRILPFSPLSYRQDVHNIVIYCLARNNIGTIVSPPQRVTAVMSQYYEVSVSDEYVIRGSTAVLKCHIPGHIKPYVSVISWIKNSAYEIVGHGEKYSVFPTGEFHIRDAIESDDRAFAAFGCKTRNIVSNQTQLSSQGSIIVSDPSNNITPRIIDCRSIIFAEEGSDFIELPCAAQARPSSTYSWHKVSKLDGLLHALNNDQRYEYRRGSLIMRNVRAIDANKYICVAANNMGEAKCETQVITFAPLKVFMEPKKLSVELSRRAIINCSVDGYPINKIIWLHNGQTVSPNDQTYNIQFFPTKSILVINDVSINDQGIWQCMALNSGGDSALDVTQLILDGLPPYFIELFDDQNVSIDDKISLKCVGTGHPIPMITWSLDATQLEIRKNEPNTLQHAMFGDYIDQSNRVISYLNLTVKSVFDGGVYECIIKNRAGINRHSAVVRVEGPTSIRKIYNKNVTQMGSIILYCPVVGDKPNAIQWFKDNKKLPLNHRHRVHLNGTLEIIHLDKKSDSGIYTCIAFSKGNTEIGKQSVEIEVKVPPVIEDFSFNTKLEAGMRTRIYCNVAQGDQPVNIGFFKDGKQIDNSHKNDLLGITVQEVDRYSLSLAIEHLSPLHNGNYSCEASNEAGRAIISSVLQVNVPPKWMIEPKDGHAIADNSVLIDCSADGFPVVQITWKRMSNSYDTELNSMESHQQYYPIRSGPKYQVFQNGTLRITDTDKFDSGKYLCQASNGIGSGLSTIVSLIVHIGAKFRNQSNHSNVTVHESQSIALIADAVGDHPITIEWILKNDQILKNEFNSKYVIEDKISENQMTSKLTIKSAHRNDSGLIKVNVMNAFGSDRKILNLIVQEPPEAPNDLSISSKSSRTVALSWKKPFNGNDLIKEYVVQYYSIDMSSNIHFKNVSIFGNMTNTVLRGLQPSKEYSVSLFAINRVGKSKPSIEISFFTEEESPSSPPTHVLLTSIDANSLKIEWHSPPSDQINGDLKGFYIGYKALNSNEPFVYKTIQTKPNITSDTAFSMLLQDLRPYTQYSVMVQAYNSMGAGPRSDEMIATTGESVPSSSPHGVSCVSFSSQSLTISWDSIPQHYINGILKGYRIHYRSNNKNKDVMKNEVTALQNKLTLYGLQKYTNYSIAVNAFTQAGNGAASDSINCRTQEDIPTQPAAVKCILASPDSVIISWKPPEESNGNLKKYTVYRKTSDDSGVVTFSVPSHLTYYKTSNLLKSRRYSFWVTASTSMGEGLSSSISTIIIDSKVAARIISFGQLIEANIGQTIELSCKSVGIPSVSTEWRVNEKILNLINIDNNSRTRILMNGSLKIHNLTINDSGNYTCQSSNIHGSDSISYELTVKRDSYTSLLPFSPIIEIISVTSSSITIKWRNRGPEVSPVKAHEVYFKSTQNKEWKYYIVTEDNYIKNQSFVIEHLQCGTYYQIYTINTNKFGKSSPSEILNIRTSGREPIGSELKAFITRINATSVKLNLNTWKDGGCPFNSHPIIHWKSVESNEWNILFVESLLDNVFIHDFKVNKNYKIKVMMKNSAGNTAFEYELESLITGSDIYHISDHSPVQISVNHLDGNETEDTEVIPLLFTIVISLILLIAGLLSVFVLYKAMQKRLNQNCAEEQSNNIFKKINFIPNHKNSRRISEPIEASSAELASLTCTQDHFQPKSYNDNCDSVTTTSFHSKDDINYKYVSIPKQDIPNEYYSIVKKNKKCSTNAKQALMADALQMSPNRYSIICANFDKDSDIKHESESDPCDQCCDYMRENQKPVDCPCCAIFDPQCCSGTDWQTICQYESSNHSQHLTSSFVKK